MERMIHGEQENDFVGEVIALLDRMKARGITPDAIRISPALLAPDRIVPFLEACSMNGINYVSIESKGGFKSIELKMKGE